MPSRYQWLISIIIFVIALVSCSAARPNGDDNDSDSDQATPTEEAKPKVELEGGIRILLAPDMPPEALRPEDMEGAQWVIENRLNALGISEPVVALSDSNRITVELPGVTDQDTVIATIQKTGLLEFVEFGHNPPPIGTLIRTDCWEPPDGACLEHVAASAEDRPLDEVTEAAPAETATLTEAVYHTVMTGRVFSDAYPLPPKQQFGQTHWAVGIEFNQEGQEIFSDYTATYIDQYLGIVLDSEVLSAPRIQQHITGDTAQITGDFTQEEAHTLAIQLRYGMLPIPLKVEAIEVFEPPPDTTPVE